jgi:hypothetical protein
LPFIATRLPLAEAGRGGKAKDEAASAAASHKTFARMIDIPAKYRPVARNRRSRDRRTDNIITCHG